jgi:anaerobic nitric oxide reductase transcription regulator
VGADRPLHVDVRVIAATNRDLAEEVRAQRFRSDLLHRLDVYRIHVPPLRERREDIALLAGTFCDHARRRLGVGPVRLSADARQALEAFRWPGNVRELENVISRSVLRASARTRPDEPVLLQRGDLGAEIAQGAPAPAAPPAPRTSPEPAGTLRELLEDYERSLIHAAVARQEGNWAAAARELGMHRSNLHHKAKRLGLLGRA